MAASVTAKIKFKQMKCAYRKRNTITYENMRIKPAYRQSGMTNKKQ